VMRVFFVVPIFISFLLVPDVALAADSNDGAIVERETYQFPSYEKALQTTKIRGITSKEEYERAIRDTNFEFQRLKYMSDGLKVTAYLYKPARLGENKLPAIIFNRGSLILGDIAPELVSSFHRLASEGFVVLAPMYRQSYGGEGRDEMGGGDVNDLMNSVALAKSSDSSTSTTCSSTGSRAAA
jgi:dipeptidyl aminopeptidase/acylaminoacyl peptidase